MRSVLVHVGQARVDAVLPLLSTTLSSTGSPASTPSCGCSSTTGCATSVGAFALVWVSLSSPRADPAAAPT
jgi:hypothetical protein